MTDRDWQGVAKHAAFVGLKAFHGFHASHGMAKAASRVPYVGLALSVAVRVGGSVVGAIDGIKNYSGD
jgi:hypothetical protein